MKRCLSWATLQLKMSLSSTLTAPVTNFKLNNTSPHMFSEYWRYLIFIQHFKAIHNKNDDYKALFTPGIKMCLRSLVHNAKCRSKHILKTSENTFNRDCFCSVVECV